MRVGFVELVLLALALRRFPPFRLGSYTTQVARYYWGWMMSGLAIT